MNGLIDKFSCGSIVILCLVNKQWCVPLNQHLKLLCKLEQNMPALCECMTMHKPLIPANCDVRVCRKITSYGVLCVI